MISLIFGLSAVVSSVGGCVSNPDIDNYAGELNRIEAERLATWEQACNRGAGVVWTKDDKNRSKRCISREATQESLARIATSHSVTGIY